MLKGSNMHYCILILAFGEKNNFRFATLISPSWKVTRQIAYTCMQIFTAEPKREASNLNALTFNL